MEITASMRWARISPSKAMDFARALKGKPVAQAMSLTGFSDRKAALLLNKTLKSAIANAENNHKLSAESLTVKEAVVEEGPRMRRYWPRSRGMASPIVKRFSHLRIVLTDGK